VPEVMSEVDGGHPAAAELALDDVPVTECCNQGGVDCGHKVPDGGNG
jgi:hypothetical protein